MKTFTSHREFRLPVGATLRRFLLIALVFLCMGQYGVVLAEPAGNEPGAIDWQGLSDTERQQLLGRLTDDQVRQLVWQMAAVNPSSEAEPGAGLVTELTAIGARLRSTVGRWISQVPELPTLLSVIGGSLSPPGSGPAGALSVLVFLLVVIGGGVAAERFVHRLSLPWRERVTGATGGFSARLGCALLRLALRTLEVAVFVAVAATLFLVMWQGHEPTRILAGYLVIGVGVTLFGARVSDMLWSPRSPSHRLLRVSDADATRIHRYVVWIVALGAAQFCLQRYLRALGVETAMLQLTGFTFGVLYVVLINTWMWRVREPIGNAIRDRNRPAGPLVSLFAATWPLVYGVLTVGILALALLTTVIPGSPRAAAGFSTLVVVLALPLVLGAVRPLVDDLLDRRDTRGGAKDDTLASRRGLHRPVIFVIRSAMIFGAVAWVSAQWGFDLAGFLDSRIGSALGQGALQIGAAVVVSWLIWTIARRAIDPHVVEGETNDEEAGEIGGTGVSRIATLLPLIRKTILVVLVVMTIMISLSALGVNIGPLLAGAGVIGIAVGFGAQSLITDIISGLFFLMDDAFRRGEYVEIGGTRGTVEKISIRSFQLRHHNGPLHTIPYGQIGSITNYSRDWAIMKFEIRVPFEENVDRVRKLIKKVGQEMMADPEVAEMLLEPLKSQGVNRMDDSAFIVRCKFTAKPGKQFMARRVAYAKIQEAFAREGIQFAPRRVIVETVSRSENSAAAGAATTIDDGAAGGEASDRG